jgi:hypothetical protein
MREARHSAGPLQFMLLGPRLAAEPDLGGEA